MNDDDPTTHSGDGDGAEDVLDARFLAALRDVPATAPEVRRAHLDAALGEYDRRNDPTADAPVAPVVALRRRSARVLQIAAAIVLVVGGLAVAVRMSGSSSDQQADTASTEGKVSSGDRDADAAAVSTAPVPEAVAEGGAAGFDEEIQDATARAADDAAGQGPATTLLPALASPAAPSSPRVPAGPVPGWLGEFANEAALRDALAAQAATGLLPTGIDPEVTCPPPAGVTGPAGATPGTGSTAAVAGVVSVVWVQRGTDGTIGALVLVDPATCRPIG